MPHVSFYPDSTTIDGQALALPDVLDGIKCGRWRVAVEAVRALTGKDYAEAKKKLPSFTASGTFATRKDAAHPPMTLFTARMCL